MRERIRAILEDFYDRVFADLMIGFYFRGKDRARLVEKELELTLRALGESQEYTGRPIDESHRPLRIPGGHFDRRTQLLREAIARAGLDAALARRWLDHVEALRPAVTADAAGRCHD